MSQPPYENTAQQLPPPSDAITHPGIYHLSDIDQQYYHQQHQAPFMAQPMFFPNNAMYQENLSVDPSAQYYSGNRYFQSYSNVQVQGAGYVPGMPIQPDQISPDFFQNVPPPSIPQRRYGQFNESYVNTHRPTGRENGNNGRGGKGRHWDNMDSYVESQEFHNAHRDRPQQFNIRGRGRGRFPQSPFNQRDIRFGNGDGRHMNDYSKKQNDSYGSNRRQNSATKPKEREAASDSQEHYRNTTLDNRNQAGDKRYGQKESQAQHLFMTKGREYMDVTGSVNQSVKEASGIEVTNASTNSNKYRGKKDDVSYETKDENKLGERDAKYNNQGLTRLPAKSGRGPSQFYDRKKVNNRGFLRENDTASPSADKDESQRGTLTEQLTRNQYECMVCCDIIRVESPVWSCQNCHHVFHLHCTKKWARSSLDQDSQTWRCPGCQNVSSQIPNKYYCFCGRRKDPPYVRGETPHSCGESCKKKRKGICKHPCTLLCHPGPCPPCSSTINQACDCGRVRKSVRCAIAAPFKCDQACDKLLPCEQHKCEEICHSGPCELCTVSKSQECYCGKKKRDIFCGTVEYKRISFSCDMSCGRLLSCGNHVCEVLCHPGECSVCEREPGVLSHCSCGKVAVKDLESVPERHSCLDPVPTCGQTCDKPMNCGPPGNPHTCESKCHDGECGPCNKETLVRCECGAVEKEIACETAITFNALNPFKCQKRCGRKKACGRHKCSETCCVKDIHICELVCGRKLTCGIHKCEQLCHRGNCNRCMQTSFEELTCFCGNEILEPPVPCGTRVPECRRSCTRSHACDHPVRHNCHSDDSCPPCTELTEKMCMGGHVLRKNIPCHLVDISCGMQCSKLLPCKMHQCQRLCHKSSCLEEGTPCSQPCTKLRKACGHTCKAPCHTGDCPGTPCRTEITISCPCGNRTTKASCGLGGDQLAELAQFQHLSVQSMAESGFHSVDMSQFSQSKKSSKRLECDVNCALMERNKRMALALEIRNPDVGGKLGQPTFSEFLKEFAKEKKNQSLVLNVEKSISELIQTAKQSSQPNRSHAFPAMNRDQRRFVHELAECYGCETKSYDYEPNKNVVVTAFGEKSWLLNVTLSQYVFKDQHMKAPPPLTGLKRQGVNFTTLKKREPASEATLPTPPASSSRAWENVSAPASAPKNPPAVDYFDFTTN